jgi:hypothetical protein
MDTVWGWSAGTGAGTAAADALPVGSPRIRAEMRTELLRLAVFRKFMVSPFGWVMKRMLTRACRQACG